MRIILPLFLCVLAGMGGCESDSSADSGGSTSLATPRLLVTEGESNYSGYMEIFPCVSGTSTYYGNYRGTPAALSMINAMYMISDGAVETGVGTPILLPVGQSYNLQYWGYTLPSDTVISSPVNQSPTVSLGSNLSSLNYTLYPYSDNDTLYHNVNNLVYATKSVTIGSTTNAGTIAVSLARAVAGLTVQLYPATTTTFDSSIDSIRVYVGLIAYQLNFFTAAPSNQTCTVLVPLRFSPTRASAYNRVTLFPSAATPWFRIELTLANGSVKSYTTHLSQALSAGTMMTVTVNIGEILETPSGGNGFEVSNWKESSETIDIGPI